VNPTGVLASIEPVLSSVAALVCVSSLMGIALPGRWVSSLPGGLGHLPFRGAGVSGVLTHLGARSLKVVGGTADYNVGGGDS